MKQWVCNPEFESLRCMIRKVRELSDHHDIRTTMIYSHVRNGNKLEMKNPPDC